MSVRSCGLRVLQSMLMQHPPSRRYHRAIRSWWQCEDALRLRYPSEGVLGPIGIRRAQHQQLREEQCHFPALDLKAESESSLCFFHRHSARRHEAGHFHFFQHHHPSDVHLVALSLNWQGKPSRLFSVNRWVTGETWLPWQQTWKHFKPWRIRSEVRWSQAWRNNRAMSTPAQELAVVGLWLECVLAILAYDIKNCLRARDQCLSDWVDRKPGMNLLEDESLEVLSEQAIQWHLPQPR